MEAVTRNGGALGDANGGGDVDGASDGGVSRHEQDLAVRGERKIRGAYYTPRAVVDGLLQLCLDPILSEAERAGAEAVASIRILDPTCGAGNFLVAAMERVRDTLVALALADEEAGRQALRCVVGVDLDPEAVDLCRQNLLKVVGVADETVVAQNIRCADSLLMPREVPQTLFNEPGHADWATILDEVGASDGFDLVIGNPPFLNQLQAATSFSADYASRVEQRFGHLAIAYTDPAALFLVVGAQLLKPQGGRLCLIEPISILASRSAAPVRQELQQLAGLTHAWFAEEQIFEGAAVEVWAPVWEGGAVSEDVSLLKTRTFAPAGATRSPDESDVSWGYLLACLRGVPTGEWETAGVLGEIAEATADFRDQYYGLRGYVHDGLDEDTGPKLVTAGLIDPARLLWGNRTTKFNKGSYVTPRVDVGALGDEMHRWARSRLVPKVLLATQTRVLEPIVDEFGTLLPSVPVLTIESREFDLWAIAALLVSPPITAISAARHFGAALSSDALKLAARDVLNLPIPAHSQFWSEAATEFRKASSERDDDAHHDHLMKCGRLMCEAFGVESPDGLLRWWSERL